MKTEIRELTQVIKNPSIPDGDYLGTWGGYQCEFYVGDDVFRAQTIEGIRTLNAQVMVNVRDGEITVETI